MFTIELKKLPVIILCLLLSAKTIAQDNTALLREAGNLELKFDEAGALEKYKQVAASDPSNIKALVKCAEFNCSIGGREKDKNSKAMYYQQAYSYAQQAYAKDSTNSDACFAVALVNYRLLELDPENKKMVDNIKQVKIFDDKALTANPGNAKANYLMGMWHFELVRSKWINKPAVKNFYSGIFDTQVDSAIYFMEKARSIEPYFALDYLDLAKVYIYDHQPAKAIGVLEKLVKLPNRTFNDAAYKEEGRLLLEKMR